MATFTYQIRDTIYPTDAVDLGTTGSLRLTQDFLNIDAEVGPLRVTQDFLNVDAEVGPLRLTQLAVMLDGTFPIPIHATQEVLSVDFTGGVPRATQQIISVDMTGGIPRATQLVISVDVPDWMLNRSDTIPLYDTVVSTKIIPPYAIHTNIVTDGLLLADWITPQITLAPRWDFWGEGDYYREVAAVMRVGSCAPLIYYRPWQPERWTDDAGLYDSVVALRYFQQEHWADYAELYDSVVASKTIGWIPPTPTFVQSTAYKYGNTSIVTAALMNVQSGNLVLAVLGDFGTMTASCSDTFGNSWTLVGSVYHGLGQYWSCAWMSFISNPGSLLVCARHGGSYPTLHAFEFSGVNTLYQRTTIKSGGTTICATQTLDTAPGLIISAIHWGNNTTLTSMRPDAGFTHIRSIAQNNGPIGVGVAYTVTTVAGDYPTGWTIAPTNTPLGEFALAFKFVQV